MRTLYLQRPVCGFASRWKTYNFYLYDISVLSFRPAAQPCIEAPPMARCWGERIISFSSSSSLLALAGLLKGYQEDFWKCVGVCGCKLDWCHWHRLVAIHPNTKNNNTVVLFYYVEKTKKVITKHDLASFCQYLAWILSKSKQKSCHFVAVRLDTCPIATKHIDRNLVDPASSHTLVSKIKPCMSKYKQIVLWNCEWLIISVIVYLIVPYYLDNRSNSRANTCRIARLRKGCIY